jgi:hypothetical protein
MTPLPAARGPRPDTGAGAEAAGGGREAGSWER